MKAASDCITGEHQIQMAVDFSVKDRRNSYNVVQRLKQKNATTNPVCNKKYPSGIKEN